MKALLEERSQSPTPTNQAIDQLINGCHLMMQGAELLAKENRELRAANAEQRQNRTFRIPCDTASNAEDARTSIQGLEDPVKTEASTTAEMTDQASTQQLRAPHKCSGCGGVGHKIPRCPRG